MFKSKKICTWKIKNAQNHLKCLGKWFLGNFEKYEICVDSMDSERDGDWLTMSTHQPSIRSKNDWWWYCGEVSHSHVSTRTILRDALVHCFTSRIKPFSGGRALLQVIGLQPIKTRAEWDSSETNILRVSPVNTASGRALVICIEQRRIHPSMESTLLITA